MDFEAFRDLAAHQRAIRVFEDRPVDDALIEQALRVAVRAPNGGNRQSWRFLIVRERETKRAMGEIFEERGVARGSAPDSTPWQDVPVLIVVCCEPPPNAPSNTASPYAASIFPAVQNLLLALQTLGLGSVLTQRWKQREPELKAILGVPDGVEIFAIVPVGWPDRRYGRNKRGPIAEVTYAERYGQPWTPMPELQTGS